MFLLRLVCIVLSSMPVATDAFKDSVCPLNLMLTRSSHVSLTNFLKPRPSDPITIAMSRSQSIASTVLMEAVEAP